MTEYKRYSDRITGKIIIQANLQNETPVLIGNGTGKSANIDVVVLPDGKPYIPATSFAGALKSFMLGHSITKAGNHLWGLAGKNESKTLQSHIRIDDLIPTSGPKAEIVIRDGVKIDSKTATAEARKKYDYQVVEPGVNFPVFAEITLRASMAAEEVMQFVANMEAALKHDGFRVGANTNTGFGKMTCSDFKAFEFDFPTNAEHWFNYLETGNITIPEMPRQQAQDFEYPESFSIEAVFQLKSSLMIGAYGINGDEPDKSHLKSGGKFVLPGKSIRGAIRHRALKILHINHSADADNMINSLFGYVSEDERSQNKGRLRVEEYLFKANEVEAMIQDRIRIDRFTGGTIDTALFSSQPVWTKGAEAVKLTFTILKEATPEDKKLLLLLLKDLWLEDLAIGGEKNIGRGILVGKEANIVNNGKRVAAFERDPATNGLHFTHGSANDINDLLNTQTPDQ